uniref:Uncharacterized protein n=1 Tax=Oryza punctata TaxID=4537 RepID=A0A0E0KSY1_ORYPU
MGEKENENRKGKDEEADHSKKDDKEACLEEYKKLIDAKTALRQSNLNPEKPGIDGIGAFKGP